MGKNKLRKFAEMQEFPCVFQYPFARLQAEGFPLYGKWHENYFHNSNPIVLELGCGKGEYTVGLARRFPDRNFIGIDIKGARIFTGAKEVNSNNIANAAFLRTDIELLPSFFAPGEVAEIWITFPDPQMKKTRRRLTSTRFLKLYRQISHAGGRINLKTDSPFLFEYTRRLTDLNHLDVLASTADLYGADTEQEHIPPYIREIRTFYEQQWLSRGKTIKYHAFLLPDLPEALQEPEEEDIERDDYRSFPRGIVQKMPSQIANDNSDN